MPNVGNIVVDIQVFFSVSAVQPDAFAPDDMHRFVVEQGRAGAQQAVAPLQELCIHCHRCFQEIVGVRVRVAEFLL